MRAVYLDWAATTPPDIDILNDALRASAETYANPSSNHWLGHQAKEALEESRAGLMRALGISKGSFIFTGGGSEADHIPLLAVLSRFSRSSSHRQPHIIVSSIEHSAIDCQTRVLEKLGVEVSWVNPDASGRIDPAQIAACIKKETSFITVMAVNNETGAIQDVREIGRRIQEASQLLKMKKPWFHVDAVQMLGKLSMEKLAEFADSFAVSAHKIRGPRGIGGLWLSRPLEAFVCGGGQETGMRPGTENLFGAIAFRFAVEKASTQLREHIVLAKELEARLIDGLSHIQGAILVPKRISQDERYVPSIVSIAFPGLGGETMVRALSDRHIAVSTGSACSSNQRNKSRRVLRAMGVADDISFSTIRLSTGPLSTRQDIDEFLEQSEDLYRKLKT